MDGDGRIGIDEISSFPNHVQRGGCGCDLYDLGKRIDIGFQGRLEGLHDGIITIIDENENRMEFPKEQVAKTRLAVIF